MKQIVLSLEEKQILQSLTIKQLHFLKKVYTDNEFDTLKAVANFVIDVEKNIFFAQQETKYSPDVLYAQHAFARGTVGGITKLLHIFAGAEAELIRREKERKKRKEQ